MKHKRDQLLCDICGERVTPLQVAWWNELLQRALSKQICPECGAVIDIWDDDETAVDYDELAY